MFDKNTSFTYDLFKNTIPHFLDTNISINGKDTFTGQYTNFDSPVASEDFSGSEH